jgi:hypothetical protein
MAEEIVLSVKQGVQSKVASVNIGTQDEAIREKAMELMSDEESALAHFSFFDIPIPIGVQQAD